MSLRTWWLENKLRGIDGKLRRLRFAQKRLRDRAAELAAAKRGGLSTLELDALERELHARRERLQDEVAALVEKEQRVKDELRRLGASLAAH